MYKAICYFTDLQDNKHPYNVGDIFPRNGLNVNEERIKELSGSDNRQRKPLIQLIEDYPEESSPFSGENENEEESERQYTKSEINRMSTADLQELALAEGIENAYSTSGGELKKILIQHFGL